MSRHGACVAALAVLSLSVGGCSMLSPHPAVRCPQIVHYSDAQLNAIQKSINRLSPTDPLRSAMHDYENLRDDARFCNNLLKEEQ